MNIFGSELISGCDHRPKEIFKLDGVAYYSADENHVMEFDGDLVVNLTKHPNPYRPKRFKELMVPWPDFGIPAVEDSFWANLHKIIRQNKCSRVCIQCGHSHGRTGTALASILIANRGMSAANSVKMIRVKHCRDAVETEEQIDYLLELDDFYNDREPTSDIQIVSSMGAKFTAAGKEGE